MFKQKKHTHKKNKAKVLIGVNVHWEKRVIILRFCLLYIRYFLYGKKKSTYGGICTLKKLSCMQLENRDQCDTCVRGKSVQHSRNMHYLFSFFYVLSVTAVHGTRTNMFHVSFFLCTKRFFLLHVHNSICHFMDMKRFESTAIK